MMQQSKRIDSKNTTSNFSGFSKFSDWLTVTEFYLVGQLVLSSVLSVLWFCDVPHPVVSLLTNAVVGAGVVLLCYSARNVPAGPLRYLREFYILGAVLYVYFYDVFPFLKAVRSVNYDAVFASWDYALFGVNPTQWIGRFSFPLLTEYLQVSYFLFFLLTFGLCNELYLEGRRSDMRSVRRTILFGFLLSYMLYIIAPAIGPRFSVHDYTSISTDLPGIFFTEPIRALVDGGDGIRMVNGQVITDDIHPNCMPSGHTMMSVMTIVLAFRYRVRFRAVYAVIGVSIIVATIYLRYHYVVDMLAGVFCAAVTLAVEPMLARFIQKKTGVE